MADVALNETLEVVVVDGASNNGAEMVVNADGSVNIEYRDLVRISSGGLNPANTQILAAGAKSLVLSATVPVGKTWYVTHWIAGGKGKGTAQFAVVDVSGVSTTLLDSFDALTSITSGGAINSFVLDSTDKVQGTNSIKTSVDFSGGGLQTGKLTKTYSPTLDLTPYDSLNLSAKSAQNNSAIFLKVFQGGSNYTFAAQNVPKNMWGTISFDLSEITGFTPNAIDKIEVNFAETVDYKLDYFVWIDNLHGSTGELRNAAATVYFSAFASITGTFPRYAKIPAGFLVNVYITNNDAAPLEFSASFGGVEV